MRKRTITWGVLGALCLTMIFGLWALFSCTKQDCYHTDSPWLKEEIGNVYDSPDALVEDFFSTSERYSLGGEKVKILETDDGVTIIIEMYNLLGDSVLNIRYRYDLIETGDGWEVDWVGTQFQCGRSLSIGWSKGFCV